MNNHIPGVYLSLMNEGRDVQVRRTDGYVGQLQPGLLRLYVHDVARNKIVLHVGYRDRGDLFLNQEGNDRGIPDGRYWRGVHIKCSQRDGTFHTEYPYNCMYVVEAAPPDHLKVWRTALISRNGFFYLVCELAYCAGDERDSPVALNTLNGRALLELLARCGKEMRSYWFKNIDEIYGNYRSLDGLRPEFGRVMWWSTILGIGGIYTWFGRMRLHWENVLDVAGLVRLTPGQVVTFTGLRAAVNMKNRASQYKWDALGVRSA